MVDPNAPQPPDNAAKSAKSKAKPPKAAKPPAKPGAKPAAESPQAEPAQVAPESPSTLAPADEPAPAAKAKKEKPPSVEDKPFATFIQEDYLPALKQSLENSGVATIDLTFAQAQIPIPGYTQAPDCWQVMGQWQPAQMPKRAFSIFFFDEGINGLKGFSCAQSDRLSTMESFLIDERKVTLDLLVFGAVQRLNGQKWLARN